MTLTLPPLIWLLLALLAAYRVAYLVALEEGPFGLAEKLRGAIWQRQRDTWLDRGINCIYCVSFWTSAAAAGLLLWGGVIGGVLLLWGGIAGGILLLQRATEPRES